MFRLRFASLLFSLLLLLIVPTFADDAKDSAPSPRISRFLTASSIELSSAGSKTTLQLGERTGPWTLMEIVSSPSSSSYAILEDFQHQNGHILFIDLKGVRLDLPKSSEPTSTDPKTLYAGHTFDEIANSPTDLLSSEILSKPGDPNYEEIARIFPPIRKMDTYSFLGSPQTFDKVGFAYGGRTPDFDPAPYYPAINKLRSDGNVLDGLVGGYLPVLRFVYPESESNWTEMLAFAPLRISNDNDRIQPVWYRVVHIENGSVKWARYLDSYHPFPPRTGYDPKLFYRDLNALKSGWDKVLAPAMKIDIPDERIANMARYSLIREMMTRVQDFPRYGAVDKNYGGSEHDGFPDTFTVDTTAMLEWGLIDTAGRYIDNYFGKFVRDDGSILYRGPETGQYGRMLTVVAQYINDGGDPRLVLKHRTRIDGVAKLLLHLRATAQKLPPTDPAYGMIAGWSEADACLDPDPPRYMQPYFSNSTEAARGFRDLGRVYSKIGKQTANARLTAWGQRLIRESESLQKDIQAAISRSMLQSEGKPVLPAIAGVKEPFHVVVPRDPTDPQFRSYRAYMEMLYSGILTRDQVKTVVDYRSAHHDLILGIPTAYGYKTSEIAGFLSYGHGYALIQHDLTREALLMMYAIMSHQYTRGTWTAPETRSLIPDHFIAAYCTPAQLVVPLLARWLLVFEDPQSETLWLGKAIPRTWLQDGKTTSVTNAPTRWGRVGFSIVSHLKENSIAATLNLPPSFPAATRIRLRTPNHSKIQSVTLNGHPWTQFDAADESILIPAGTTSPLNLMVHY